MVGGGSVALSRPSTRSTLDLLRVRPCSTFASSEHEQLVENEHGKLGVGQLGVGKLGRAEGKRRPITGLPSGGQGVVGSAAARRCARRRGGGRRTGRWSARRKRATRMARTRGWRGDEAGAVGCGAWTCIGRSTGRSGEGGAGVGCAYAEENETGVLLQLASARSRPDASRSSLCTTKARECSARAGPCGEGPRVGQAHRSALGVCSYERARARDVARHAGCPGGRRKRRRGKAASCGESPKQHLNDS